MYLKSTNDKKAKGNSTPQAEAASTQNGDEVADDDVGAKRRKTGKAKAAATTTIKETLTLEIRDGNINRSKSWLEDACSAVDVAIDSLAAEPKPEHVKKIKSLMYSLMLQFCWSGSLKIDGAILEVALSSPGDPSKLQTLRFAQGFVDSAIQKRCRRIDDRTLNLDCFWELASRSAQPNSGRNSTLLVCSQLVAQCY